MKGKPNKLNKVKKQFEEIGYVIDYFKAHSGFGYYYIEKENVHYGVLEWKYTRNPEFTLEFIKMLKEC